jgi:hypothetical protein
VKSVPDDVLGSPEYNVPLAAEPIAYGVPEYAL